MPQIHNKDQELQQYVLDHQICSQQPINNEESFISAQLKLENWQYINDFDDSEMIAETPQNYIYVENNISFLEDTKKALGEFQEIKKMQERGQIKYEQQQQSMQYKITKKQNTDKNKQNNIQKNKRIKKQKNQNKKQKFNDKQLKKINSLKNISSSVCDYVDLVSCVSYNDLFHKFIGQNGNKSKNLKRRMYDVINVLSSVQVLKKKGQILAKVYHQKQQNFDQYNNQQNIYQIKYKNEQNIKQLQNKIKQKKKNILQKKQILFQLQLKKKNLLKLYKRNSIWINKIKQNNKITFPFLCFIPQKQTTCQITPNQAKLIFPNHQQQQTQVLTQSDAISYVNLKVRKKIPPKMDTLISYELIKGVAAMCLGQDTNKP